MRTFLFEMNNLKVEKKWKINFSKWDDFIHFNKLSLNLNGVEWNKCKKFSYPPHSIPFKFFIYKIYNCIKNK